MCMDVVYREQHQVYRQFGHAYEIWISEIELCVSPYRFLYIK